MSTRSLSAAVAAAAVLLAGCGAGSSPGTDAAPTTSSRPASAAADSKAFNEADVAFARNMIPHHRQAVEMADMVANHTDNTRLRDLAARIRAAQQPEIEKLRGWLREWNVAPSGSGKPGASGHATHHMTGMMSDKSMAALRKAQGSAFDDMWLRMMIEHHEGAVTMARTELDRGRHDGARNLARQIIDAQKAEIAEMRDMLATS